VAGLLFLCLKVWAIRWTRYNHKVSTGNTLSIEGIPDQLVIFKGGHNVKDLGATGTDVDRAKGPQIGPRRLRKDTVGTVPAFHSWQGE
jgi:hypothetical protein